MLITSDFQPIDVFQITLLINVDWIVNYSQIEMEIFEYIEAYYNGVRIHS